MNIFAKYKELIIQEAVTLYPDLPRDMVFTVEAPRDASHGDMATNIALIASKRIGVAVLDVATQLMNKLTQHPDISKVETAGPGFINISIKPHIWHQCLQEILSAKSGYGESNLGQGDLVNLEFVSCNPTGPVHVGHARGAVFGDCLARILKKTGFKVVKEFYINDAGGQIIILIRSVYARYLQALGEKVSIPEGGYPGEYLVPIAEFLVQKFNDSLKLVSEEEFLVATKNIVIDQLMHVIKKDLRLLGVDHEIFISEQHDLHDQGILDKAINKLHTKNLIYQGVLSPPKGKVIEDWEAKPQTIFSATQFGDDVDRPLIKANGQYTYFSGDIAYHYHKLTRGFNNMIVVLGADHIGYTKRLTAAVAALSDGVTKIDIKVTQLVNLLKDGQPYKMSKRAGNFITVKDMVDELGADIIRFIMLTRKGDTVLDLDFALAKEETKDNPVFYVQYACARASSILRKGVESKISPIGANLTVLQHPEELRLIQKMAQWPRVLESSAILHEPHRITHYLHELSTQFHSFWNLGTEDEKMRFIVEGDEQISAARISLVQAVQYTIVSALDVLGVRAMERM